MRAIVLLLLLLLSSLPPAQAQPAGLTPAEQDRVTSLLQRALAAARTQADAIRTDPAYEPGDRRDVQVQYAIMLSDLGRCDDALAFVQDRAEVGPAGIEVLMSGVNFAGDRACALRFARLARDRTDEPDVSLSRRTAARYLVAAYLDAAGDDKARDVLAAAEATLLQAVGQEAVWSARFNALDAYLPTPRAMPYLEYLADRMVVERYNAMSTTQSGLLVLFAGKNRCDLVERVLRRGPASCDQPRKAAEAIYIHPRLPGRAAGPSAAPRDIEPAPAEQTLANTLAQPDPRTRMFLILQFIWSCREALRGQPS